MVAARDAPADDRPAGMGGWGINPLVLRPLLAVSPSVADEQADGAEAQQHEAARLGDHPVGTDHDRRHHVIRASGTERDLAGGTHRNRGYEHIPNNRAEEGVAGGDDPVA